MFRRREGTLGKEGSDSSGAWAAHAAREEAPLSRAVPGWDDWLGSWRPAHGPRRKPSRSTLAATSHRNPAVGLSTRLVDAHRIMTGASTRAKVPCAIDDHRKVSLLHCHARDILVVKRFKAKTCAGRAVVNNTSNHAATSHPTRTVCVQPMSKQSREAQPITCVSQRPQEDRQPISRRSFQRYPCRRGCRLACLPKDRLPSEASDCPSRRTAEADQ